MDYALYLKELQGRIDDSLEFLLDEDVPYGTLIQAMNYSVNAGGKRLRPALLLEFCRMCGGNEDWALPAACGVV